MRSRLLILVAGIASTLGAVDTSVAAQNAGSSAKPASIRLLTASQRNILKKGRVRVRVRATASGSVRLVVLARRSVRRAKARRITRGRAVRFRAAGRRTVKMRLTPAGRKLLRSCQAMRLSVRGRWRARARASARGLVLRRSTRRLRRDTRRCRRAALAERVADKVDLRNADRCDFLDPSVCLYPWPNDRFTDRDAKTASGRRLAIDQRSMPANRAGVAIDVEPYNRYDGFSPGNLLVTRVPGLDTQAAFARTGAVPITDIARSFDAAQPVVVINARTRERHLVWSEIDANPANRRDVTLIIRPAVNFAEGERYIVALRNLKDAQGDPLLAGPAFRLYRDKLKTDEPQIERRRAHFEEIFSTLSQAGIGRDGLYLAWDFTVASERGLSERVLFMRNDAFAQLGDTNLADMTVQGSAPTFVQNPDLPDSVIDALPEPPFFDPFETLDGRRDYPPCSAGTSAACEEGESETTARRIAGQISVPCYLDQPGCVPGSRFSLGADGLPTRTPGNTQLINVLCTIPRAALGAGPDLRLSLYGHGLIGSAGEVGAGNVQSMGNEHGFVFCATDWSGMSIYDFPNILTILQDLSRFPTLTDRAQQSFVNQLYLGRWMIHPAGLASNSAFEVARAFDTRRLFYDGNSQGGIMGGALAALGVDHERAVLGVPGMNYSTLLRRSVDFDGYANGNFEGIEADAGLYDNYPNELERPLILSLIQLHWDRAEANGYAHHMTNDPLPNTPPHQVLLHPAFGDHQVADVTVEVEARTIGASVHRPVAYPGRHPYVEPYFGVPSLPAGPFGGSGVVVWDSGPVRLVGGEERGTPAAPTTNTPPRLGRDPHEHPRRVLAGRAQKSAFLSLGGALIDVCGGPCYADGFTGP
jgi:hypothetical protein